MLPLDAAAAQLGVASITLARWARQGCPHSPGRRGRGHRALFDPAAVRAWRSANDPDAVALALSTELPKAMAAAAFDFWRELDGPAKRAQAGLIAALWYAIAIAATDCLRERHSAVPEIAHLPEEIQRLLKIARG